MAEPPIGFGRVFTPVRFMIYFPHPLASYKNIVHDAAVTFPFSASLLSTIFQPKVLAFIQRNGWSLLALVILSIMYKPEIDDWVGKLFRKLDRKPVVFANHINVENARLAQQEKLFEDSARAKEIRERKRQEKAIAAAEAKGMSKSRRTNDEDDLKPAKPKKKNNGPAPRDWQSFDEGAPMPLAPVDLPTRPRRAVQRRGGG